MILHKAAAAGLMALMVFSVAAGCRSRDGRENSTRPASGPGSRAGHSDKSRAECTKSKSSIKAPFLLSAVVNDASGGGRGIQPGDQAVFIFSASTDACDVLQPPGIDSVLGLSNSHSWGVVHSAGWSSTAAGDDTLTITFGRDNGSIWKPATRNAPFRGRHSHASVIYKDKMWVIAGKGDTGYYNDVWYSSDGTQWTNATPAAGFCARKIQSALVFNDRMWVVAGMCMRTYRNDVWYSTDGAEWTQAAARTSFGRRYCQAMAVYRDRMWIIGGRIGSKWLNDVWYSKDGVNWECATDAAAFPVRFAHRALVYRGKMWIVGGWGPDDVCYNDVWNTTDGVNWTLVTGNAPFVPRYDHTFLDYKGMMWVIAGRDRENKFSDVWNSKDGREWTEVISEGAFSYRQHHTSLVFNDRMWLISGKGLKRHPNDVWYSTDGRSVSQGDTVGVRPGTINDACHVHDVGGFPVEITNSAGW